MKNKLYKNMLNKRGPKIDPWGTSNKIFSHELNSEFILVLCFLFDKKLYISLKAGKLKS